MTRSIRSLIPLVLALMTGCGGFGSSPESPEVRIISADSSGSQAPVERASSGGDMGYAPSYAEAESADRELTDTGYTPPPPRVMAETGPVSVTAEPASVAPSIPAPVQPAPPPMDAERMPARAMADEASMDSYGGEAMAPDYPGEADIAVTTTTTTTVTVTAQAPPVVPIQARAVARLLTAASVGDVDRRGNYLDFLSRHAFEARRLGIDTTRRVRFRVVDGQGNGVLGARIQAPEVGVEGRTHTDGVWDFYPGVVARGSGGPARFRVSAGGRSVELVAQIPYQGDGQEILVRLPGVSARPVRALELAFLIDVTGSMEDELRYVNQEVGSIVARVQASAPEVAIRVGATFYRDRTDSVPLSQIPFTNNVAGFASAMSRVRASGGGDYPEDMNAGLRAAMAQLGDGAQGGQVDRVLVIIADAPPQRYRTGFSYLDAMRLASARGIRIVPVAASGADREVEYLFRAMGAVTSTPYVYLTDDSGIGGHHQEADTDRVAVEYLSDLLTRMLVSDLHGRGMHEPGGFGPGRGR
ncbi:MAG: VWA domain-containing protein [Deltaproteobacteria bacterium]|nr:VWA domain-containing protein [Deltaproteobacteria bacterium]